MNTTQKIENIITPQSEAFLLLFQINRIFYLARQKITDIDKYHLVIKIRDDGSKTFRIEPGQLKTVQPNEIWISFRQHKGRDRKNNIFTLDSKFEEYLLRSEIQANIKELEIIYNLFNAYFSKILPSIKTKYEIEVEVKDLENPPLSIFRNFNFNFSNLFRKWAK